jgi:2-polyprenyl-3-methyl-5-hydroxy-6-metoxy-1,4-benzoquinol methylase
VTRPGLFQAVPCCWICDGTALETIHELIFETSAYREQDPALATYTGCRLPLRRCRRCGFAQPAALPSLPRFFDRLYNQRWSSEWVESEFHSTWKDAIFDGILANLASRLPPGRRRLLDVGAHAGRFIARAVEAGWLADGLELNPRTAACAAARTGRPIRQVNVRDFTDGQGAFDAVVLTDVLEHIPEPRGVLVGAARLLAPGGWIAVKVPHGANQLRKEQWRGRLHRGYRPTVADNLVHVSHFSPRALAFALTRSGFGEVALRPGTPELPPGGGLGAVASRVARRGAHAAASWLPGGIHTPLAFNLQAFARLA